ncbi:cell surface A33 antigen [Eublepharis macularius]|uniref:Cell surface A33 antigen n=1 Tax=Eublepharis macularius TaxID=481883 RepID=A0AA97KTX2_EUBMA|nr:cell surface A33 antigen [Eublepharis macularius]
MRANKGAELLILSVAVAAVVSLEVETPKKKVEVAREYTATLPCTFRSAETSTDKDFGVWKKISSDKEFVNWYFDGGKEPPYIDTTYKDRVSLSGNPSSNNLTITLSDVTMDDNGTYECSVRMRHDPPVKSARMDLFVLVAPSIPECKIIGTAVYGHNINLTCSSQEGSPKPQYSWQRFDVQNQQKELTRAVASGGILTLKNVSADTSGYYICTSTNSVGQKSCNMTVSISPPSMNIGLYAGIIGGVVAAIIAIGIIAYCCCCRKRKDEMTEKENGYQPPQNEPVRIRGPAEEEIQDDEEEQREEDRWKQKPLMPPTPKPEVVA